MFVKSNRRNFIIHSRHQRWKRLWQFFFTGWGLVMVAALVASALFTRQLLWTPISAINMFDIASNQFKMSNASFSGTDKNGNPFTLRADNARQEYDDPDTVFMDKLSGTVVRMDGDTKITDNIRAATGRYNRKTKSVTLNGNVRIASSNGDTALTQELVIQL